MDAAKDEDAAYTALKWLPIVWADRCTGCGRCVEICGPRSLQMRGQRAFLVRPDTCGSENHCATACEFGAIEMAWVPACGDERIGRWRRG